MYTSSKMDNMQDKIWFRTPRWRVKLYTIKDSMEVMTEDMSDETFLKRHAKFEAIERQQKKLDEQRTRELKHNEDLRNKLIKRISQDNKNENEVFQSFYPKTTSIKCIEITNNLPDDFDYL